MANAVPIHQSPVGQPPKILSRKEQDDFVKDYPKELHEAIYSALGRGADVYPVFTERKLLSGEVTRTLSAVRIDSRYEQSR